MKTNLLKSIFISLILLMGVSNALGKDIYFKPSDNWKEANAWFQVWDGEHNHNFESTGIAGLYKATIEDGKTSIWIKRKQPNTENDWDGGSETKISTYNYFYNSGWSNSMSRSNIIGTVRGGKIYFDNSKTKWTGNIQFVIGHDSYSRTYSMSQLKNTDLWYVNLDAATYREWGDAKYYAVISTTNKVTDGGWGSTSLSTKAPSYRTTIYKGPFSLDYGSSYLVTPSSESPAASSITISYVGTYSSLNYTQTIKTAVDGADANSKAAITVTSYDLTGNGTISSQKSASISTSAKSTTISAARTATTTLTVGSVATGYQFDGWYAAKTGGTAISTSTTYTYYPTSATTVYARFSAKKYNITYKDQGDVAFSGTHASGYPTQHTYGTTTTLKTATKTGYTFGGWFTNSGCTDSAVTSLGATTYTANITLYAKWTIIEETKYDVTISSAGNGTVEPSGTQKVGASGIDVTATANTGYKFKQWSYTAGAKANSLNTETTLVTATGNGTVTASFEEILYDITITSNNAAYGDVNPKSAQAGIATTVAITASPAEGYEFVNWTAPSSITLENANNASTTITKATAKGTVSAKFQEKKYNITVLKDGKTSTTQQIGAKTQVSITAATLTGFEFVGWVVSDEQTPGCITIDDPTKQTAKVTATGTGTITATYKETGVLYFKNNLGWSNVYVYFHTSDSYWDATLGSGSYGLTIANGRAFKMERIGNTDIYKCHYGAKGTVPTNSLAFTPENKENYDNFHKTKASYRTDFNSQMELFIPQNTKTETKNETDYYNRGIWMKYNSTESGYDWRGATSEDANDPGWSNAFNFTASKPGGYTFKASVTFNNTNQHFFKIHNIKNDWFGNGGTMTQNNCTNWTFGSDNSKNAKITPTITGTYIFTIYLGDGEVSVSLDYPLSVGDYRLAYKDKTEESHHPGHYLKKRSTSQTDTVSFFIHYNQTPEIIVEKCTRITDGVPTWAKVTEITINPAASITESGVYNFYLQQIDGNTLPTLVQKADPYKGNYYIRTDAADGGWDAFRQASNKITYSSFADTHSNFNHYYCKYIDAGRNVKFTIANDYSYCISDTLDNDDIIKKGQSSIGCLPINANVRFGWDSNTNEISRAYIKGAGQTSDRFLVLQGKDDNLKDANGDPIPKGTGVRTGLEANEEILVDQQNWIYQVDVTANNQTFVKLIAEYNGQTQYFKGNETEYTGLLSSTASDTYKIRLVYDFKSNHLVIAWMAAGKTIEGEQALGADMMVIRRNQEAADQLNFNPLESSLEDVKTGYAVMTFTKAYLENLEEDNVTPLPENRKKTERERSLYWVSFPFDVKISDVFGFGEYAEHWIMQYYDGAERAEKGLFIDSGTYWKYIEDTKTTLNAGQGYVLALDLSKVEFLHGATEVSLYFPSIGEVKTITGELTDASVPEHWCSIEREWTEGTTTYFHKYTDSHWNLIGVPGFADIKEFNVGQYKFMADDPSFYYNFDLANSTYTVQESSTNFQAMYAYMVQFAGTINWSSKKVEPATPKELAARRYSDEQPEKVVLRLELAQGEEQADRTFIQLEEEGATAEFDLSRDLTKIINKGANIYTLAGEYSIQTAGNALPMEEAVVPVGVDIATAGEYTFRMPDGTEGMVVELLDYEANTRTNLLLSDYTVTLQKGSNENRFALYIQPSKSGVTTGVENVGDKAKGIEKYLIDGKLIIRTADGVLYDAQGHCL